MAIHAMYKDRWTELFVCALVVSIISLLINTQNPTGIILVTSLASTSLGLMIAPGSNTNSVRSVCLSYIIAMLISISFGLFFNLFVDDLINNETLLFFIKFLVMLIATLFLFGLFNAYHPPAVGAMLAYFINTELEDLMLLIYVPLAVVFLLATIKSYIYSRHKDEFKWNAFSNEFKKDFHVMSRQEIERATKNKTALIAKALVNENIDVAIISKTTNLTKAQVKAL